MNILKYSVFIFLAPFHWVKFFTIVNFVFVWKRQEPCLLGNNKYFSWSSHLTPTRRFQSAQCSIPTGPMYFVFRRLYPFSPQPTRQCLAPVISSQLLTNTVSPGRPCLIIWWERFCGTQKEDDRGPLSIESPLRYIHSKISQEPVRPSSNGRIKVLVCSFIFHGKEYSSRKYRSVRGADYISKN
jgi:hypothetical protein